MRAREVSPDQLDLLGRRVVLVRRVQRGREGEFSLAPLTLHPNRALQDPPGYRVFQEVLVFRETVASRDSKVRRYETWSYTGSAFA